MTSKIIALFVTRGGIVGINFVSLLVIAALMESAEFGTFVFLWAAAQLLSAIAGIGGVNYLMREGAARQGDSERGVTRIEAASIALGYPAMILATIGAVALGLASMAAGWTEIPAVKPNDVLAVCAAAGALIALSHSATPLRLDDKQTASMIVRDAGPSGLVLVAFLTSYTLDSYSPTSILLSFAAIAAVSATLLLTYTQFAKAPLWRQANRDERPKRRKELQVFWGNDIVGMALTQFDILIGAAFVSNTELGHYQILKRLANFVGLPLVVTNWSATVALGRFHASKELAKMQKVCVDSSVWSFLPGLGLLILLTPMLYVLLPLYNMTMSPSNITTFLIIGGANLMNLAFGVAIMFAVMSGKESVALRGRILGCVFGGAFIPVTTAIAPMAGLALSLFIASTVLNVYVARQNFAFSGIRTDVVFGMQHLSKGAQ